MNIPISDSVIQWTHYLVTALFILGLLGLLIRKNALVVLMCIELMLNAANLLFVEYSMRIGGSEGIMMVIFVITVAAAEAAIGLGIILNLYRLKGSVQIDLFKNLAG